MSAHRMPSTRKQPARHKRPTPRRTRQGMALGVTGVMSAGAVLGGASAAHAESTPVVSQATGTFLSGSVLGTNLDNVVSLDDAGVKNFGDNDVVSEINPLGASLLNSLNVPIGPVNLLAGSGLLTLGAVNQAAVARSNGKAVGGSGAVSDSGAIAVGGKNGVPASNATLDLGALLASTLGTGLVADLLDLDLEVGAISANATQAKGESGTQVGDYNIASLRLELEAPVLTGLLSGLGLGALQSTIDDLDTTIAALPDIVTFLGLLGAPSVSVTNTPVLADIVTAQDTLLTGSTLSVNLTDGRIVIDIEDVLADLGLDLNNLPPNTELVGLILNAISTEVLSLVTGALNDLITDITDAVGLIDVEILDGIVPQVLGATEQAAIDGALATALSTVLGPANTSLTDFQSNGALTPVFDALEDLLSIRVNVQSSSGGTFTQRALQVRVLPGTGTATVNLASAGVGPGTPLIVEDPDDPVLPKTGASPELAAAGLAMVLAGAAATAGSAVGGRPAGAHAAPRGRARGRHAKR